MRGLRFLMLLLAIAPGGALAGAWPREEGRWFLSLSQTAIPQDGRVDGWTGLYLEQGFSPRLTFGLDAGRDLGGARTVAVTFLRWDVAPSSPLRLGLTAGAGSEWTAAGEDTLIRLGLAAGRGHSWWRGGWMEAEVQAVHRLAAAETTWKADLTLGLSLPPRSKAMLQLHLAQTPDGTEARLVPSYVLRLKDRVHVTLGLTADLTGGEPLGLKIGTWLDF